MNNKAINEFGSRRIWIIKQIEEGVIQRGLRLRMLMSKIVNNDVSKDATIVTCLLSDRYDRIWEIRDMESADFLKKKKFTILFH